jgi:hypothetical protein
MPPFDRFSTRQPYPGGQIVPYDVNGAPALDAEKVDDFLTSSLVAGTGITITHDEVGNTFTIASTVSAGAPLNSPAFTGTPTITNNGSGDINHLTFIAAFLANEKKALAWKDATNFVGKVSTLFDGTATNIVISHLYNGGYGSAEVFRFTPTGPKLTVHPTTASASNAVIDAATGALARSTSLGTWKKDIRPIRLEYAYRLLDLDPIRYRSNSDFDDQRRVHWGWTAEDAVAKRLLPLVALDTEGNPSGIQYERAVVALAMIDKHQEERIVALEAEVAALKALVQPLN